MAKTDFIDEIDLKDELVNFIRWTVFSLDDKNRETRTTQTFDATSSQTDFPLTYGTRLRFVESVTLNGVPILFGDDYDFTFPGSNRTNTGKIILNVASTLHDAIVVIYGYANQYNVNGVARNKDAMVYPDFPRSDLSISKYPRIGLGIGLPRQPGGLSGGTQNVVKTNIRVSVIILMENTFLLDTFSKTLNKAFMEYAKKFYNFRYIIPENTTNITLSEDVTSDVLARNIDLIIPDRYEFITYA